MENVTKALKMAAGILLGIMVLSLMVYFFKFMNTYAETAYYQEKESHQVYEYNKPFLTDVFTEKEKLGSSVLSGKDFGERITFGSLITALNYARNINTSSDANGEKVEVFIEFKTGSPFGVPKKITLNSLYEGNTNNHSELFKKIIEHYTIKITRNGISEPLQNTYGLRTVKNKKNVPYIQLKDVKYDSIGRIKGITYVVDVIEVDDESVDIIV